MIDAEDPAWKGMLAANRTRMAKDGLVNDVLQLLRQSGYGKVESIRALIDLEDMTPRDAKVAIHLSAVWSDRHAADEALHDEVEQALRYA